MKIIKFFREKNALSIKEAITKKPSAEELIFEHLNKLKDKALHIKTICNKQLRDEYLKKKKIYEKSLKMTENMVEKLLFERVCVDILELITNLSILLNIPLQEVSSQKMSAMEISDNILASINKLDVKNCHFETLNQIYQHLVSLCDIYHFSMSELTEKRDQIIIEEGSFLNGLYVFYDE